MFSWAAIAESCKGGVGVGDVGREGVWVLETGWSRCVLYEAVCIGTSACIIRKDFSILLLYHVFVSSHWSRAVISRMKSTFRINYVPTVAIHFRLEIRKVGMILARIFLIYLTKFWSMLSRVI